MAEGIEALGDVVTGGLAARAVEPAAGEHSGWAAACLNCKTPLVGEYCHSCGQQAHVHRTLAAFWHDLAHSVLHFEGKIWRTLPLLAWHPGRLTRRYIEGERANFVSPMALFLFSVFLMFAAIGLFGAPLDGDNSSSAQERAEQLQEYRLERAENETKLRDLNARLAEARAGGQPVAAIQRNIDALQLEMKLEQKGHDLAVRLINEEEAREKQAQAKGKDPAEPEINILQRTGWTALDEAIAKAEKNPSLIIYKLQTNAYKFSWALIPISVPFVWLLFLHRRRYRQYRAYDHVVFVTYSLAFMTLGFIAITMLGPLDPGGTIAGLGITFVPPIHMYRQLRGAYQLSRWSALWRTFFLLIFAMVAATLFLMLLLLLGVLG